MSLKKLGVAMIAVLAIGAVVASSASAAVSTTRAEWYTGSSATTTTTMTAAQPITAAIAEHPTIGLKATLQTVIGGKNVDLTATGIECVECKIENKEVTEKAGAAAFGTGKIKFTGVTAMEPTGCTVSSEAGTAGVVETKQLNIHADFMDTNTENLKDFVAFIPTAGATTTFAQFQLAGGECTSIAGPYNVKGTVYGESKNNTGVAATTQELVFSPTVQTTAGAELKVGSIIANFTGTGKFATTTTGKTFFSVKP